MKGDADHVGSHLPYLLPLHPDAASPELQRAYIWGPLLSFINCSECNDLLVRNWDVGDYFCQRCGLVF